MRSLRVVTWNIAGGRRSKHSKRKFDYSGRDLEYFAGQLRLVDPDIICLQECEYAEGDNIADQLAGMLGMEHIFQTRMHVSHIDSGYEITEAIISKRPFEAQRAIAQPYPEFDLHLPSGQSDRRHLKYLQVVRLQGLCIGNVQTQPLEYLGTPYESARGQEYARELSNFFANELKRPLVFAGDFCADLHTRHVGDIYKFACDKLALTDALPPGQTKPGNTGRPDAIFFSPELKKKDSKIVHTETDHFLCWAELEYTGK